MSSMNNWSKLSSRETIEKTIEALGKNNIDAYFVENRKEAKKKALEMIPLSSHVLVGQSITLEQIGLTEEIEKTDKFVSIRKEYMALDREKDKSTIRKLRTIPDIIVGSVNAVTKGGRVLIASNTGNQLAAYAYGAGKVIWVVGGQKIVDNFEDANKRIYEYVLPLESERLKKLYGVPSYVSKILVFDKEVEKDRVKIIFVNEVLGF